MQHVFHSISSPKKTFQYSSQLSTAPYKLSSQNKIPVSLKRIYKRNTHESPNCLHPYGVRMTKKITSNYH